MSAQHGVTVRCIHNLSYSPCTRYEGTLSKAPKRTRCEYCRGRLVTTPTVWGVVAWRKDARYSRPEVVFTSPEKAQAACPDDGLSVVRPFMVED